MPTMPQMAVSRDHTLLDASTESGATLAADAQLLAESPTAAEQFVRQSLGILVGGQALGVGLAPSGARDGGVPVVAGLLRDAAEAANARPASISLSVCAGGLSVRDAWRARLECLGAGPLFVVGEPPESRAEWQVLWELRNQHELRAAVAAEVVSCCSLLAAEPATVVEPAMQIQAPVASAWFGRRIWLPDFVTLENRVDERALLHAATNAVDSVDEALSHASWPTSRMRHDAWLNRRLAVELAGIGTLVLRLGLDPANFGTLLELSRIVNCLIRALVRHSRVLASTHGPVPALGQAARWPPMTDERLRRGWLKHWHRALKASAQRHRNIVTMSPWSLFPEDEAPIVFANLAPLLRYADACAFTKPPDLSAWSFPEFVNFHRQIAAVLQQRSTQRQIAEPA